MSMKSMAAAAAALIAGDMARRVILVDEVAAVDPGKRSRKKPRAASTYRAARRNQVLRIDHGVWRHPRKKLGYQPVAPKGTSAYRVNGKAFPHSRRPPRRYKPNGAREVARRRAQIERRAR